MTTESTDETILFGLTAEELVAQAKEAGEEAIARMHSKGIAVVFAKDNVVYRPYPNGRLEPVEPVHPPYDQAWLRHSH